jgi:hypothetical protein
MPTVGNRPPAEAPVNCRVQLVAGVVCMVMIANLQIGDLLRRSHRCEVPLGRTSIRWRSRSSRRSRRARAILVVRRRFGPRLVVMFGGIVVAGADVESFASTLPMPHGRRDLRRGSGAVYGTRGQRAQMVRSLRPRGRTDRGRVWRGAAATVVPIISVSRTTDTTARSSGSRVRVS